MLCSSNSTVVQASSYCSSTLSGVAHKEVGGLQYKSVLKKLEDTGTLYGTCIIFNSAMWYFKTNSHGRDECDIHVRFKLLK